MRTDEQIDAILRDVKNAWQGNRSLRLGQLIYNAISVEDTLSDESKTLNDEDVATKLFYIEDQALVIELYSNMNWGNK